MGRIETLVVNYYGHLNVGLGSKQGELYGPHNGTSFRFVNNIGFLVEVSLDAELGEQEMAEGLRRVAVDLSTTSLDHAFRVFGLLAARYHEGQPIGFDVYASGVDDLERIYQCKSPLKRSLMSNRITFRGSLDDVRMALVRSTIPFSHAYVLDIPEGKHKLTLLRNDPTGRTPEPARYKTGYSLVGREAEVLPHARLCDKAISPFGQESGFYM